MRPVASFPARAHAWTRAAVCALAFVAAQASTATGSATATATGASAPGGATQSERTEAAILRLEDRREFGPEIFRLLADNAPAVRARAALAAGRIGDPAAIDPLAALLRDRDPSVRASTAFALGEIEDSAAAEPLAWLLRGDEPAPGVRARAIEGLGKLTAHRHGSLCVRSLADSSREVREAACLASWQMRAAEAAPELLALGEDSSPGTRWKATYALMRMLGTPASGRTAIPGGTELAAPVRARVHDLLIARARDPDLRSRMAAVRGLGRFADPAATAAIRAAMQDADWRVRVEAARAYVLPAVSGGDAAGRAIATEGGTLIPLLDDPNPNVRITALEALGGIDAPGGVTALESFFGREGIAAREREVAAIALADRWKAAIAGAKGEDADSLRGRVARLGRSLAASDHWSLRAAVPEILEGAGTDEVVLLRPLLHDEPRVAKTAVEPVLRGLLGRRTQGKSAVESLAPDLDWLLASPDPVLRAITIDAATKVLQDSSGAAVWDEGEWAAVLRAAWDHAQTDPADDVPLAILGALEPHAARPDATALLREGIRSKHEPVRREAYRILKGSGLAGGFAPPGPIETGRTLDEYERILGWARGERAVEIRTPRGTIRIALETRKAPLACWNFVHLAESGFYDHGSWHRIVPDFVVQDGCPRGDGYGGPGYTIRCEINENRYDAGTVGMALSGKDTGGSQFFIAQSPQPHLDGRYTVFGHVTAGMDVVDRLIQGDAIDSIRPAAPRE